MILQNHIIPVNENGGLPLSKRYWAILATALGVGISVIDVTIANVALPTIAHDLGTSPSVTIWIVNAYQMAITISLLSFSSLGDIYGYRKIYLSGVLLFSITSGICACADSFWTLTTARILQGFGAAAITGVNTALLRIIYPKRFLGRGMGINALVIAVSTAAGPTIASIILSLGSWHWLFAINIPVGIATLIIGLIYLPDNPVKVTGRHFDKFSCLMNAVTFGLLIFLLEGITHKENTTLIIVGVFALLIIGYFFVRRQLRQQFPLEGSEARNVDIRLYGDEIHLQVVGLGEDFYDEFPAVRTSLARRISSSVEILGALWSETASFKPKISSIKAISFFMLPVMAGEGTP